VKLYLLASVLGLLGWSFCWLKVFKLLNESEVWHVWLEDDAWNDVVGSEQSVFETILGEVVEEL